MVRRAYCLADRQEWEAELFASLNRTVRYELRHDLRCLACGGKALFRSASARRPAMFAARHSPACLLINHPAWGVFRYLQ
ncbi:hypothetical protein ACIQTZ_20495 [Paenarthrobacter sp. NPDC090520]|uniref:hypothetical protein n=1 Tax=Paenarthrobacter sp. NPDC090520 TaxID=3364382 RepID=UPI0037F388F5